MRHVNMSAARPYLGLSRDERGWKGLKINISRVTEHYNIHTVRRGCFLLTVESSDHKRTHRRMKIAHCLSYDRDTT
jgi:hypothetical protein